MEGGYGGFDLYYATRINDMEFEQPVNLGAVVNSADNEVTPYWLDGQLFFSSDGRISMGGLDIYVSKWNGSVWDEPQNLGMRYNSNVDDYYFSIDSDGTYGMLVSNRVGTESMKSETCCDDIFSVFLDNIICDLDATTYSEGKPLNGVDIQLVEMTGNKMGVTDKKNTGKTNALNFNLLREKSYVLIAAKEGFIPDTVSFNTVGIRKSQTFSHKLNLKVQPPVLPEYETYTDETPIRLNNIYYDFDDDKILPDAEDDLQLLLDLLRQYADMVIELSSHTDSRGNKSYNQDLSQRRAESAKAWLVERGVVESRIKPVGYGESVILNKCTNGVKCTDDEHRFNRRTEFKILAGPTSIKIEKKRLRSKKKVGSSNTSNEYNVDGGSIQIPDMVFEKEIYDLGTLKKGERRTIIIPFANDGTAPMSIEHASGCDCTILEYPSRTIQPGEQDHIIAHFNTTNEDLGEKLVDITIVLAQSHPRTGYPIIEELEIMAIIVP